MTDARDYRAIHVGRRGEVAGGMTQVVNAYLSWEFPHFEVQFLQSRGESNPLRAARIFLRAAWSILFVLKPSRDLIVIHMSQGGSFIREGSLLVLARIRGYATVAQLHGSGFVAFATRFGVLARLILRSATGIHVLSEATSAVARSLAPRSQIVLIPNAVEDGTKTTKTRSIVFGGAVSRRKGVDTLLASWDPSLAAAGWSLVVAGPIVDADIVPEQLPAGVTLQGAVPHVDLLALLDESEIAVLPSRDEAMPMFLIEAMARRNAVVSTTVGGIPDLLAGGAGILIDPGDEAALSAQLRRLVDDAEFRREAQAAALRAFDGRFSARVIIPKVDAFWLRLMAGRS